MDNYNVEKWIWTEQDFELMSWHDCHIYALAFPSETYEMVFDIDYILDWIVPEPPETNYKFWIAPATLVFENVHDVTFDFDSPNDIEMDSITREKPEPVQYEYIHRDIELLWTVSCHRGVIEFRSTGFKQYIRSNATLTNRTKIDMLSRGGISFSQDRNIGL